MCFLFDFTAVGDVLMLAVDAGNGLKSGVTNPHVGL